MRNTFEGFVVNDSNREAFEFANKVAKQETTEANPLFVSGPSGCGKSHLLDGIWHHYVCADNGKHPEWTSSFALTERFKNFTQGKCQFADKFNELDLLLFDDIDLVDDKCNGELLSQVIDELVKRGKQICVASTKSLDELSSALIDAFSKGKCVTVSLPTKEEQRDFYKQLSKREGISLHGEEPYDYLCEKQKDFRAMKAEFVRLKYKMICENCETASLGVGAVKRYLEN